jgi:ABC-type transport system involved in cytochrome bd biosynthesis fused ATPase/permease subunit
METLNRNHISYQEMDELIGLAEKVSENIETLKSNSKKELTSWFLYEIIVFITVLVFTKKASLIENFSLQILIGFLLVALLFLPSLFTLQKINNLKNSIQREKIVIQKLLNMIEGYKDLYIENEYGTESSVVSKALFEMRLSRINFGVK